MGDQVRFYASRILIVLLVTIAAFGIGIGVEIISLRFFATYQDSNYVAIGASFLAFATPAAFLAYTLLRREPRPRDRALLYAFAAYIILWLSFSRPLGSAFFWGGLLVAPVFFIVVCIATMRK